MKWLNFHFITKPLKLFLPPIETMYFHSQPLGGFSSVATKHLVRNEEGNQRLQSIQYSLRLITFFLSRVSPQ